MFIDSYDRICKLKGVSPTSVLKALGISKGVYSNWKAVGAEPLNPTKLKIANYLGVSIEELETGEIKKAPAKAEADVELINMLEDVRRNPDLRVLFSLSKNATPESVKQTIKILKALSGDDDGANNC